MKNQKPIIVKKVKKHAAGHHGGSWKVAYADFVTAMMAFFLLMWLLNMTSEEKRVRLSEYFKHFSIFATGAQSVMSSSSEIFSESGQNMDKVFSEKVDEHTQKQEAAAVEIEAEPGQLEKALKKALEEKLGDLKDQVIVDEVKEGVRIQVVDKDGSLMFERGRKDLTGKGEDVLKIIGDSIKNVTNTVKIEGHTDSHPYGGNDYSNWELSTDRASTARKILEANGLDQKRITQVSGFADTDPLIKENPADPKNRRISIIVSVPVKKRGAAATPGNSISTAEPTVRRSASDKIKKEAIPSKTSSVVKNNAESSNYKKSQIKQNNPASVSKEENEPAEDNTVSGPVIDKNSWSPVIDSNLFNPVTGNN